MAIVFIKSQGKRQPHEAVIFGSSVRNEKAQQRIKQLTGIELPVVRRNY